MKCPNCLADNTDNAKYCKKCGHQLTVLKKTCVNGHNYDANLSTCPYCPPSTSSQNVKTVIEGEDRCNDNKTLIDSFKRSSNHADKTRIINPKPAMKSDRTMIYDPNSQRSEQSTLDPENIGANADLRKLVGWIVTYDLQPSGLDFRLYVGKNKVGRNVKCDLSINHSSVSDEHAMILFRDGKLILKDMLSVNGTYVNDEIVEDKVYLNDGDIIKLGSIVFKLRII
ncbi:MAG: FHA domain-containing protein [Candidatus Cloacimonetes bacterium]|jgi:hypothetical protein|nr:FHA domain-containing protein [Candidatus Cloacimonadota bacterium]MCK9334506.1 FHA domain-containing protein [Candidatus Cloacimonadota bacterium]